MICRIFGLEEEKRNIILEKDDHIQLKNIYYEQKLDEAHFEIEKQLIIVENFENMIEDIKKQHEVTKTLYACELNQKIKNQERNNELMEKYRQVTNKANYIKNI